MIQDVGQVTWRQFTRRYVKDRNVPVAYLAPTDATRLPWAVPFAW